MLPVALRRDGRRQGAGRDRRRRPPGVAELGVAVAARRAARGDRPLAGGLEVIPASEVIAMDADPGAERPPQEGLVARPGRRGGPRRQGLRHGLAPATPGPPWPAPCCAWAASRASARPAIATPIPVPGHDAHGPARRRRQRRVPGRVARAVRPDGRRLRPRPLRHRRSPGSACCRSARRPPRARRSSRRRTPCWRRPTRSERPAARSSATSRAATS